MPHPPPDPHWIFIVRIGIRIRRFIVSLPVFFTVHYFPIFILFDLPLTAVLLFFASLLLSDDQRRMFRFVIIPKMRIRCFNARFLFSAHCFSGIPRPRALRGRFPLNILGDYRDVRFFLLFAGLRFTPALFEALFFGLLFEALRADELRDAVFGVCFGFGAEALRDVVFGAEVRFRAPFAVAFFVLDAAAGRVVVVVVTVVTPFAVVRLVTLVVTVPLFFFAVFGVFFFVAMF